MNKKQEQQILDYYSTTDKYIRSRTHSNAHQTVFTKESDRYQWLVLEQKSQCEVEVRQTDSHGTITSPIGYFAPLFNDSRQSLNGWRKIAT